MAAVAVHVRDKDIVTGGYGYTVILVEDCGREDVTIGAGRHVKAIGIVGSGKARGHGVGGVTGGVVESYRGEGEASGVGYREAVSWVVLDVEVVDGRCPEGVANGDEVIGSMGGTLVRSWVNLMKRRGSLLGDTTIRALTIPP